MREEGLSAAEYDRLHRKLGKIPILEPTESSSIVVDSKTVVPQVRSMFKDYDDVIPEEYVREAILLGAIGIDTSSIERVEVVGRVGDVDAIRRVGGAYDHNEGWRNFMRRCGRLR